MIVLVVLLVLSLVVALEALVLLVLVADGRLFNVERLERSPELRSRIVSINALVV